MERYLVKTYREHEMQGCTTFRFRTPVGAAIHARLALRKSPGLDDALIERRSDEVDVHHITRC